MPEQWQWNQVASYRLTKSDVEKYLRNKFGERKFELQVCLDLLRMHRRRGCCLTLE